MLEPFWTGVIYRLTQDGTWIEDGLSSPLGVFGDPCILAGPKGDFYYLHLSDPSGEGWANSELLDRIVCHRSKDGGESWSPGVGIGLNTPKDQDKEWAITDRKGRRVVTTWTQFDEYSSTLASDSSTIMFSSTNRRAKRWSQPVRINQKAGDCLDGDNTVEGAVPAYGPDGEIYVAWAFGESIYFDHSFDHGKSWREQDIVATKIVGGWSQDVPGINRANGMPVTVCDLSGGEFGGRIYVNFVDDRNGNFDVWVVSSDDHGITWSEVVKVNTDDSGRDQFFYLAGYRSGNRLALYGLL